jgi:class 3 adenylate cyclase
MLRVKNAVHAETLRGRLLAEQENSEQLLLNILPRPIADRMKKGETNIADLHANATVLVADLVGFNSLSSHIDSRQIVQLLNEIFSAFDLLVEEHGLETIKTVGDAYMVGGGISISRPDHAEAMVELAISLQDEIEWFNHQYDVSIRLRIGISTGPVIAGVIGSKKFTYDVWGETVNLAWRLEASAEAGRIQISEATRERLKEKYQSEKKRGNGQNPPADSPGYWLVMPDDDSKNSLNLSPARHQRSRVAIPV